MTEGNAANKQDTFSFDGTLVPVKVIALKEEESAEVEIVPSPVWGYADLKDVFAKLWSSGQRGFCELNQGGTTYRTHAYIRSYLCDREKGTIRLVLIFKGTTTKAKRK